MLSNFMNYFQIKEGVPSILDKKKETRDSAHPRRGRPATATKQQKLRQGRKANDRTRNAMDVRGVVMDLSGSACGSTTI